jgi:ADP-ribose pyrophosphatase YjhB (NUDIX family)
VRLSGRPPVVTSLSSTGVSTPTLPELEQALRAAWSLWTADPADHDDWSGDDPASGQCASTALIVHDTLGGALLMAHVRHADGSPAGFHYFNRLPDGTELDLTAEQFHDGEVLFDVNEVEIPDNRHVGRLPGPYHLLAARVARELAAPGTSGGERPVSVKGVCADARGRVLLCRNHRGEWELPGGRPQREEVFSDTLRRELREETGLEIEVGPLLGVRALEAVPGRWVDIVAFACELAEPAAQLQVSDEHSEVAFHDPARLGPDELTGVYRELIRRTR